MFVPIVNTVTKQNKKNQTQTPKNKQILRKTFKMSSKNPVQYQWN